MPYLVVVYGPPLSGKTTAALQIAGSVDGKSAIVSVDQILDEAIVQADADALAELEMVHTQVRLLVANFLKNGYHTVLEGPFAFESDGTVINYERHIGEIVGLMRNLASTTLLVRLRADEVTLASRGGLDEARAAKRIDAEYRESFGRTLTLNSGTMTPLEIAAKVRQALGAFQPGR
jgi:hypothetical protein